MASLVVLIFLAIPPLLMWWMIVVQRRVREQMRERESHEAMPAVEAPYVDEIGRGGGLSYGRRVSSELPPPHETGEPDGIKALQGRR